MVVLAVAVLTRSGKALVSRQYVDMTRLRIEGLLAAFPKLISDNDSAKGKRQHTYVETDSVRYLFQPVEELYLVLITTRGSNIVQDLSTLQLVSKILPDTCTPISEETLSEKVFELVFAFDEVITLGYREDISLQEIRRNLEMESHEEKLHDMLRESKEADAREEMRRKVASIKAAQREQRDLGGIEGKPSSYAGFGSSPSVFEPDVAPVREDFKGFSFDNQKDESEEVSSKSRMKLGKGMSLRKKRNKGEDVINDLANEEGIDHSLLERQKSASKQAVPVKREAVETESVETVSIAILSDGSVKSYEVRGSLSVFCQEGFNNVQLLLRDAHELSPMAKHFKLTASPKLSKQDFGKKVLKLRNDRAFPKQSKFSLLSWKMKSLEEDLLPLKVVFWPEVSDSKVNVSIEVTLNEELANQVGVSDVLLKIPLGRGADIDSFQVLSLENGVYRLNSRKNEVEWDISLMNKDNPSGLLEFEVSLEETESLFPVEVSFHSTQTLLPVSVERVESLETGEEVKFVESQRIEVDSFSVLPDE